MDHLRFSVDTVRNKDRHKQSALIVSTDNNFELQHLPKGFLNENLNCVPN